jgi:hypothetical protein
MPNLKSQLEGAARRTAQIEELEKQIAEIQTQFLANASSKAIELDVSVAGWAGWCVLVPTRLSSTYGKFGTCASEVFQ